MIGVTAGILVFLLLLFAAVQILFNLYATSMVTSAAHEAARDVAGYDSATDRCAAVADAEAGFIEALGSYGRDGYARLTWNCAGPDVVSVQVTANHPTVLPARMAGLLSLGQVDRTIVVRVEEFQE
ncbi:MAG: TadE/TadG family type IV pilus assembly protein [Actinomycetota bacterium]